MRDLVAKRARKTKNVEIIWASTRQRPPRVEVGVEEGAEAARWCALERVSVLRAELGSTSTASSGCSRCSASSRARRASGSSPRWSTARAGCSQRCSARRRHSRSAVGVAALPRGGRSRSRSRSRSRDRSDDHGTGIAIIGGGSYQWVPKLLVDVVNTPSLADAEIVLAGHRPRAAAARWPTGSSASRRLRASRCRCATTTDQRDALAGADYVVVTISTGGFASMRHDLEIPERYGIKQRVGDTVGPGGITRALRNIPVLVGIARDMEERLPRRVDAQHHEPDDHALPRGDARDARSRRSGCATRSRCAQFVLSLLLDADFRDARPRGHRREPPPGRHRVPHRRRRRRSTLLRDAARRPGAGRASRSPSTCPTASVSREAERPDRQLDAGGDLLARATG